MITHLSASQLKTFSLCPRKWYFEKHCPEIPKPPPSLAMLLGSEVHKAIEHFLEDSNKYPLETAGRAGEIALPGIEHIPLFSHMEIEEEISLPAGPGLPAFKGFIDLLVYGDDGEPCQIIDHKTCSSWKYTKTGPELRSDIQMLIYARWVLLQYPAVQELELTHIQYLTKGRPSSRIESTTITREAVDLAWEGISSLARDMVSTYEASEGAAVNVPTKETGCSAYGGCPYLSICKHSKGVPMSTNTLASLIASKKPTAPILPPEAPVVREPVVAPETPVEKVIAAVEAAPTQSLPLDTVKALVKESLQARRMSRIMWDTFKEETLDTLHIEGDTVHYMGEGFTAPTPDPVDTPAPPAPVDTGVDNRNSFTTGPNSLTLFIDCLPQGLEATPFSALISPIIEMVRTEAAVDPLLIPYNEGPKKVAAMLVVHGLPTSGAYTVYSKDPYWVSCSTYFLSAASVVVTGVR